MESRRVDNQARGRSGRQGDEGESIFYVSLEDDLMRIFGSESMNNILEKLGLKDGESIDHPWINKALERAQQKVEARNFDIRKTLIKFDNVLNDQRHVIFSQRKNAMNSSQIFDYSNDFLKDIIDDLVDLKTQKSKDIKNINFEKKLRLILGKRIKDDEIESLKSLDDKNLRDKIIEEFETARKDRNQTLGEDNSKELEKRIFLQTIDMNWTSHIQYLEQLRQVIGLRSYGQRDPLIEYKKEAFVLFENLLNKLKLDFITILINLEVREKNKNKESFSEKSNLVSNPKCLLILKKNEKISRNDRCEATGKKYKNCCGSL